jgi:hypothetical protein
MKDIKTNNSFKEFMITFSDYKSIMVCKRISEKCIPLNIQENIFTFIHLEKTKLKSIRSIMRRVRINWKLGVIKKTFPSWDELTKISGAGVYEIKNMLTLDSYIGSTVNLYKRSSTHKSKLVNNIHPSQKLQCNFNEHGIENFRFIVLESVNDNILLVNREQFWIDSIKPTLNVHKNAGSPIGTKASQETKNKMSIKSKGHKRGIGRIAWNKGLKYNITKQTTNKKLK